MTLSLSRLAAPMLGLGLALSSSPGFAQSGDFRLGTAIEASLAERSITISADTRWSNVEQGESIRFVSGPKAFGWKFDGTRSAIDLAQIAPSGFVSRPLVVYVTPPPRGRGGD